MSWFGATVAVALGAAVMAGNAEPRDMIAAETTPAVEVIGNAEINMGSEEFADMELTKMTVITMVGEDGAYLFSFDNGETWLTEEEVMSNTEDMEFSALEGDNITVTYSVKSSSDGDIQADKADTK